MKEEQPLSPDELAVAWRDSEKMLELEFDGQGRLTRTVNQFSNGLPEAVKVGRAEASQNEPGRPLSGQVDGPGGRRRP